MFKNYVKMTLRNLKKYKAFSFINVAGLAIGMACAILILLWVQHELNYDKFHKNVNELYRVEQDEYFTEGRYRISVTPYPAGPAFKEEIPEVIDATRYDSIGGLLFRYKEKSFYEDKIAVVDPSFLHMFSFPLVSGDKNTVLNEPFSLVITERIAEKYFPGEEPLGKVILVSNQYDVTVTGVLKNVPKNSFFSFDMLFSSKELKAAGIWPDFWDANNISTFVRLQQNAPVQAVNEKMTQLLRKYNEESTADFVLKPFADLHLHAINAVTYYGNPIGNIQYVYIFSVIGLFVLLIACINYMNLSTARSANRAKEIGLRKVVGASRGKMIQQFLGESVLMAFLALIPAVVIVELLLPFFNTLIGTELSLNILANWQFLRVLIGITFCTGVVAGSYPALFLSSFQPITILKNDTSVGPKGYLFRKLLVVIQFALSVILIIGTVVVYNQLDYMKNRKLGYNKEQLLYVPLNDDARQSYETLKSELSRYPGILSVTGTNQNPSYIVNNSGGADWDGKDPDFDAIIGNNYVDYNFIETLKIEMVEGRTFSPDYPTDRSEAYIINEEVVKLMGVESAVGKNFSYWNREGKVIGVMKNFHFKPVREEIEPFILMLEPDNVSLLMMRVSPENIASTIGHVKLVWDRLIPNYPLEYRFLDDDFAEMYRAEERIGDIVKYFSFIAIFIACLGLFGLASFTVEKRTKEIGIRKVLGASVSGIVAMLSKEFVRWALLANIIAWPVAYFTMNRWLQNFAYRISMGWLTFLLAGTLALVIALLTVSYQAIRAATANPVESLRYE